MTVVIRPAGSTAPPVAYGILTLEHRTTLPSVTTVNQSTDGAQAFVTARAVPTSNRGHELEVLCASRSIAEALIETTLARGIAVEYHDTKRPLRIRRGFPSEVTIRDEPGSDVCRLMFRLQEVPA